MKQRIGRWMLLCAGWLMVCTVAAVGQEMTQEEVPPMEPATPAPGEEIMQPTQRGIRLTPEMAIAGSRIFVEGDLRNRLSLDVTQQEQMIRMISKKAMKVGHENSQNLQQFIEYFVKAQTEVDGNHGHWDQQTAQEFARKAGPLMEPYRDFVQDILRDSRGILTEEQYDKFQYQMKRAQEDLDKFKTRMERWSEGEVQWREDPFQTPGEEKEPETAESREKKEREKTLRRSRRMADEAFRNYGPKSWAEFLAGCKYFFEFNPDQSLEGDRLLAEYKAMYEQIATPDWREQVRVNRMKVGMQHVVPDMPTGPWVYSLEEDFQRLIEPVADLGDQFRKQILGMVTQEQRWNAWEGLRKQARRHGLKGDDNDLRALGLMRD